MNTGLHPGADIKIPSFGQVHTCVDLLTLNHVMTILEKAISNGQDSLWNLLGEFGFGSDLLGTLVGIQCS